MLSSVMSLAWMILHYYCFCINVNIIFMDISYCQYSSSETFLVIWGLFWLLTGHILCYLLIWLCSVHHRSSWCEFVPLFLSCLFEFLWWRSNVITIMFTIISGHHHHHHYEKGSWPELRWQPPCSHCMCRQQPSPWGQRLGGAPWQWRSINMCVLDIG